MKKAEPGDLTLIYYTANYLEDHNPYFLENTKKQLLKAADGLPIVIVSHKPTMFGNNSTNIVVGEKDGIVGRGHLNIYKQILIGSKTAKTPFVAMAEDDILYSWEHFHDSVPEKNQFLYDMNKLSLFTWSKPPIFSFRHNRRVVNQLIADRQYLVEAMEERFRRVEELRGQGVEEEWILSRFGDPGRYEERLGVTKRNTDDFMSTCPSIVFSHEHAYGFESRGTNKALGDLRIIEVPYWGRAEEVIKLYDPNLGVIEQCCVCGTEHDLLTADDGKIRCFNHEYERQHPNEK